MTSLHQLTGFPPSTATATFLSTGRGFSFLDLSIPGVPSSQLERSCSLNLRLRLRLRRTRLLVVRSFFLVL